MTMNSPMDTTLKIRGHHLLCMLTHVGKGYTPDFTRNMGAILKRIAAGECFLVIKGPDSICFPRISNTANAAFDNPHCHEKRLMDMDGEAFGKVSLWLDKNITCGSRLALSQEDIKTLRTRFQAEHPSMKGCLVCEWNDLCNTVAQSGFEGCIL